MRSAIGIDGQVFRVFLACIERSVGNQELSFLRNLGLEKVPPL